MTTKLNTRNTMIKRIAQKEQRRNTAAFQAWVKVIEFVFSNRIKRADTRANVTTLRFDDSKNEQLVTMFQQAVKASPDLLENIRYSVYGLQDQPDEYNGLQMFDDSLSSTAWQAYRNATARKPVTFFVTRHKGAADWAARNGHESAQIVAHFDPAKVEAGDIVLGTLPVHLAADVCFKGGRYFHLSMDIPAELRGKELTADDMDACGASLVEFKITRA